MYKLIVMDLDGTLLNSYGEVSLENRKAIQYALEKNVELVLASGRDSKTIEKLSLELGIKNYLISGNGASIYDIKEQKNIYENFIDKEKALKVAQICKENSIFFNVYTTNGIITESLDYNVKVFNNENNNKPNDKKTNIEVVKDIYNYIEENEPKILKIIICDNSKIIFNNIMEKLRDVKNIEILNVEHMSRKILRIGTEEVGVEYFYTEITNKNANKWSAIEYLIKLLKITKEETICIGDNINDYEMVKNSGLGIAMKNSALEKEKIAKYITEDNNSNGVGNAIFKYI
jgi:Cof subfamily protein (haloacid dehalogenase superfamily)